MNSNKIITFIMKNVFYVRMGRFIPMRISGCVFQSVSFDVVNKSSTPETHFLYKTIRSFYIKTDVETF